MLSVFTLTFCLKEAENLVSGHIACQIVSPYPTKCERFVNYYRKFSVSDPLMLLQNHCDVKCNDVLLVS
jgi:hypothetical protein